MSPRNSSLSFLVAGRASGLHNLGTEGRVPPDLGAPVRFATRPWLLLASLCLLLGSSMARADVTVGAPFPSLASANLTGTIPSTAGQVVLVDFWASWCVPCKASFPAFAKLHSDYASRGLVIVAVSVDEKASAYEGFVKKLKPPFAVAHDAAQRLVSEVKVPGMPTSYLIGRDGKLRSIHSGYHGDSTDRELRQEIETLLAEK